MTRICILALLFLVMVPQTFAQEGFPSYYSRNDFSLASPGALKFGLYGYDNPALLTYVREPDALFTWSDKPGRMSDFNRWGLFLGVPNFGFSVNKDKTPGPSITDYQLSVAKGDRRASIGMAYGWSAGDRDFFHRSNIFKLAMLLRPEQHLSFGVVGTAATNGSAQEAVFDIAGRPFGNQLVTLFADYAIRNSMNIGQAPWSAGAAVEAFSGIRITGRYFDSKAFSLGMEVSLDRVGLSAQTHYDNNQNHSYDTYGIRIGAADRSIITKFQERHDYLELNLVGQVKYQRFIFFDRANTLEGLLSTIDAAEKDERVSGIAINMSGMSAPREMLWEIREKLKEFKSAGKKVVIFIDRVDIDQYHLASVADRIVFDPTGIILIQGYAFGKTFFKGTLDKLGIGFDEWRLFKYKSANESFSRDKMSDADREQWQSFTDEFYRIAKRDICEGRHLSATQFDTLVNTDVMLLPAEAVARGLVDTVGRWDEVGNMVKQLEGRAKPMIGAGALAAFTQPYDNEWGEKPHIALIYALGVCDMDRGIAARTLVKDVEAAGNDPTIKAIVLRIDSPGGDAMASDYISEAMKKARAKKPVIVSQGSVAGSGGYWLSMYADTIVSAPGTITGSIGVAGGWIYNKGLKETLGISTDLVMTGAHADAGFGFSLPFIGGGLSDRNLTTEERSKVEHSMKSMYDLFLHKVAEGRHLSVDSVGQIGQGRVWTGSEAKKNGLVDLLGGMDEAIKVAKAKAGIPANREVTIVESPQPALFDSQMFMPKLFGVGLPDPKDEIIERLKFMLDHNGEPMPILPLDVHP